jgi:hypothetical protein
VLNVERTKMIDMKSRFSFSQRDKEHKAKSEGCIEFWIWIFLTRVKG